MPARASANAGLLSGLTGEFARFLLMGGANTLVAYAIYLLLLTWMRYEFAYAIGYAVGIAMACVLSSTWVFRRLPRRRSAIGIALVYLLQFLLSFVLLRAAVEWIGLPAWLAFAVVVAATIPVTFALSRCIVRTDPGRA